MLTDTAATGAAPEARVEPRPVICRGIEDASYNCRKMDRILPAKIKLLEKTIKLQAVTLTGSTRRLAPPPPGSAKPHVAPPACVRRVLARPV